MRRSRAAAVAGLALLTASALGAQTDSAIARDSLPRRPLFTPTIAITGGAFLAGAGIVAPFDRRITDRARARWLQQNGGLRHAADAVDFGIGSPGAIVISGGVYVAGLLAHDRPLAGVGIDLGEAVVAAGATTELIKVIAGRARPSQRPEDPWDWGFGRGLSRDGYASFPSASTTLAFALASAASIDAARAWPRHRALWPILFYTAATAAAAGRVYRNDHWASDVVAGAGVGTLGGLLATRFNILHPNNPIRRWFLPSP
jgi:membrane-associated phospholipid phosphatase